MSENELKTGKNHVLVPDTTPAIDLNEGVEVQAIKTKRIESDPKTKKQVGRSTLPFYLILILCAVISISATAGTLWWYHANIAPKVIVFDLPKFNADLLIQNTNGVLTNEQVLTRFDEMTQWLDGLPPNHVVLLNELVLQNGEPAPY